MKSLLNELKPRIFEIYQYIQEHPEVSWEETETTSYVSELLKKEGIVVKTFSNCTGAYADIGHGKPLIGLRVDMDALWQEVNGSFQANHSCGHDAHTAMGIGVLLLLKKLGKQLNGTIRVIFQPAEETGNGALTMIGKEIMDDIDFLYGVHVRPEQEVLDGQGAPAIQHGSSQIIRGEIVGEDTHGARPHLGVNAIEVGFSLNQHLQQIHLNPMIPFSVKLTKFQAGGKSSNTIPGSAQFSLDLRAQTNEAMNLLTEKVNDVINGVSDLYRVEINSEVMGRSVAAETHQEAQEIMKNSIEDVLGKHNVCPPVVTSGGEDFHHYTFQLPHLKATMLGLGCGLTPGLHHPKMTLNSEALIDGVHILTRALLKTLERYNEV